MPTIQFDDGRPTPEVLSHVDGLGLPGFAEKLVPIGKVRDLYHRVRQAPDGFQMDNLLAEMRVGLRVTAADTARIPATGPVVVVANHPFGVLDGAVLTVLLTRVRPDVKVLTNFLLRDVPELQAGSNGRALREALVWLQTGGMLAIFPAVDVSHWQMPEAKIADPQWNETAVRLVRKTAACILPVYFCGRNSVGFQLLGRVHPRLRSAFLLQEFLQQEGKTVELRVGSVIASESITGIATDREAIEYLRWRTYLLARRSKPETSRPAAVRSALSLKTREAIAPAVRRELLADELDALPEGRCLLKNGDLAVYLVAGE
jgi:putative hemolysin